MVKWVDISDLGILLFPYNKIDMWFHTYYTGIYEKINHCLFLQYTSYIKILRAKSNLKFIIHKKNLAKVFNLNKPIFLKESFEIIFGWHRRTHIHRRHQSDSYFFPSSSDKELYWPISFIHSNFFEYLLWKSKILKYTISLPSRFKHNFVIIFKTMTNVLICLSLLNTKSFVSLVIFLN